VRGLVVVLALCALVATPGLAVAQTAQPPGGGASPFQPLPPPQPEAPPETEQPAPAQPTALEEDDPSTLGVFGLFAVGVLVIVLIAFFIMRDARKSLPQRKRPGKKRKPEPGGAAATTGSRRPPPPRSRKGSTSRTRRKQRRAKRRAR
jgi:hypothetical protein